MGQRRVIGASVIGLMLPLWCVGFAKGLWPLLHEFPPLTRYVDHAPYSAPHFFVFLLLFLFAVLILACPRLAGFQVAPAPPVRVERYGFPRWGRVGMLLIVVFWPLAWHRWDWLPAWLTENTFFPLWLGYILVMDGMTFQKTGTSWIGRSPRLFVLLFPASAVSWWYFEFLNRFVQNWWYAGVETHSATGYALMATVSFSTVFPAIFTTQAWLSSFPRFDAAYRNGPRWRAPRRTVLRGCVAAGVVMLGVTAWHPVPLFFLTWVAPLLIVAPALALAGVATPFDSLKRGDYHHLFTLALAALVCGWFWEMWNFFSMPKWHYTVPYVQALEVFEMPLPGYAGYLPFGPICWCMWAALRALFSTKVPS